MASRDPGRVSVRAEDGTQLSLIESGDPSGWPILFLHGLGYGARVWRKQLESPRLRALRLLALDLRGHGNSGWMLKDTFDRTAWSGDIRAVFDQLRLEDVTLVAWSYSGLVLADYLAVHGEHRIRALGLVAAATRAGFAEAYLDYGSGALPEGLLSDDPVRSAGADGVFVAESAGRHPFTSGDAKELVGIVSGTPREVLRRLLSRNVDNADLWARTAVPVLLSHGTHDRINLPVISQRQASTIPGSRSSVYADAGHLPFWEQPARFNTELLDLVHNPASVRAQRPPSVSSA